MPPNLLEDSLGRGVENAEQPPRRLEDPILRLLGWNESIVTAYQRGDQTSKYLVDWDQFLSALGSHDRASAGSLLHAVCARGPPVDVVQAVLKLAKNTVNDQRYSIEATPLHLACFSDTEPPAIRALLETDARPLLQRDALGQIPLHLACRFCNSRVVQLLLEYDLSKESIRILDQAGETPLQIASRLAGKKVVEELLRAAEEADRNEASDFCWTQVPGQLPLHRAISRRISSPANLVRLLSTGQSKANLTTKDHRGQVPLHIALEHDVGAPALGELIENDVDCETFHVLDDLDRAPPDLLLRRILDQDESVLQTLRDLAQVDQKRRFFRAVDAKGLTILDKLLVLGESDHLSSIERDSLFLIASCTPPGAGDYSISISKVKMKLSRHHFQKLFEDPLFHRTLNNLMFLRSFTVYFMVDLYVRIFLVVCFTIATTEALEGNLTHWTYPCVYLTSLYLLAWQVRLIWNHELFFLREGWNVMDLMTEILVIVSVGLLQSGKENVGSFRVLNVLVGGLVWFVIVTAALRSTFLPFSVFLSGFTMVSIGDAMLTTEITRLTVDADPLVHDPLRHLYLPYDGSLCRYVFQECLRYRCLPE